jgi:hypothetical protein
MLTLFQAIYGLGQRQSAMVEHLPNNPKVEGLNLGSDTATATRNE